jgi:TonB family protein
MSSQVKKNWFAAMPGDALAGAKGKSTVVFRIQSDGKIEHVFLEVSSGTDSLDQAALKGVRDSSPLDPLPPIFKGPYIELRFIFEYNLKTTAAPRGSSLECHAPASNTTQAQPFDRLELLAFLAGEGHSQYAEQAICERGIIEYHII